MARKLGIIVARLSTAICESVSIVSTIIILLFLFLFFVFFLFFFFLFLFFFFFFFFILVLLLLLLLLLIFLLLLFFFIFFFVADSAYFIFDSTLADTVSWPLSGRLVAVGSGYHILFSLKGGLLCGCSWLTIS